MVADADWPEDGDARNAAPDNIFARFAQCGATRSANDLDAVIGGTQRKMSVKLMLRETTFRGCTRFRHAPVDELHSIENT
jgi:hypothetical protein